MLRKELGVWYTPPEIVEYMVARVDTVLREELDVPDGLADPRVYVLDPCCGTGAYLVEVLERISQTLDEKGADALSAGEVKKAAMDRVFGFEILPAPFVIAHMQLGLLLQNMHLPLAENERVGVFLTNALTGWESPHEHKQLSVLQELEAERDAAEKVKQELPILVVLGNPPYNGFAGVSSQEEGGLVAPYKEGLVREWGIKKFNLDDLYVRFFRLAERRIAEMTGQGVVCFISNFSYLSDPSFVVMRRRFLDQFNKVWIDCLNGDSRETGKKTPDGKPDPSVFSTDTNPEGIRLGTAVGLMVKRPDMKEGGGPVFFRQFWGAGKRENLLGTLGDPRDSTTDYAPAQPTAGNRFSFRPSTKQVDYSTWPMVVELCGETPISGLQEMRKSSLIGIEREALETRMRSYLDAATAWDTLQSIAPGLTEKAGAFDPAPARDKILACEAFDSSSICRYSLHPMDTRWCYWSPILPLWNRPRPSIREQCWPGNGFLVTRMVAERPHEQVPFTFTSSLPDYHLLRPNVVAIPVQIRASTTANNVQPDAQTQFAMIDDSAEPQGNLSVPARAYLAKLGVVKIDSAEQAGLVWMHSLAVGYSPAYLADNLDGIRLDWPRIPLPNSQELLLASAELGGRVADLLDPETDVDGVTTGNLRPELKVIGAPWRVDGDPLNEGAGDLAVTAGWGHAGQGGVTMPGKGKSISRPYSPEELAAIEQGAEALGLSAELALAQLGDQAVDVYLNDLAYWRCVPSGVWGYTIGGYQVMKKWLSYREKPLLGRELKVEEMREVMRMARRIAGILLLQPALDANYLAVKGNTYEWKAPA
ncbi:MAG TPA: type ISP restriction/modification enzyme [Thermoleophilia bacterium]|nr:type ISP restriction/modification enzyme [Thermoleophilia bacterium]